VTYLDALTFGFDSECHTSSISGLCPFLGYAHGAVSLLSENSNCKVTTRVNQTYIDAAFFYLKCSSLAADANMVLI
jgi:hypothetical protein